MFQEGDIPSSGDGGVSVVPSLKTSVSNKYAYRVR